jgi:1-deoxy-D-xylulose-5-phosphate reductoisomerase
VDSEHNALFQLLHGCKRDQVGSVVLTASGGPFFRRKDIHLEDVTPEMATSHPNWSMGPKISVDSATLMNKGLEVIEAHYLFDLPQKAIEVWIHPQSILHGALLLKDGSMLGHFSRPDMRLAIAFALSFPDRIKIVPEKIEPRTMAQLEFFDPDITVFPALRLAREALAASPAHTIALNAANEIAVGAFLKGQLLFPAIPSLVERVLAKVHSASPADLDEVFELDEFFRDTTKGFLKDV